MPKARAARRISFSRVSTVVALAWRFVMIYEGRSRIPGRVAEISPHGRYFIGRAKST
ncbi:hypothetical protein CO2235_MP60100 [Cupriavidus oxalaticus]|uniref:Uncharacterized protein n=1 Tax=Cupriavidus oxalaticus TaxID=96344 RepID=A0A976BIU7_9BURK|nr:hypothetical protein CO2235_MP60100 [Cupriavidus oxalaticus]